MKVTTLIPTSRNDGSPVSQGELQGILGQFTSLFGGCTLEGHTTGYWIDGGQAYIDQCLKVFVICSEEQVPVAETLVRQIGKQLGQLAMYFEIDRNTEVKILDTK